MVIEDIVKVFLPATIAFIVGISLTPTLAHFLYKHEMWKKKSGKVAFDGASAEVFNELHKTKEVGTPRMGGIVVWASALITTFGLLLLSKFLPGTLMEKLSYLSRNQTWIPFATLILGALIGLLDDWLEVKGSRDYIAGGLSLKKRLLMVAIIGLGCALWFFYKLEVSTIGLPFLGDLYVGWLFIPIFVLVTIGLYSGGVIDGIDGLAGGVFAAMFSAYAGIAFYQSQINLAAFCAVIVGGLLAFLWFNIPPARFYMSETGSMALTLTLAVVAFTTDSLGGGHGLSALPIIALPLIATSFSNVLQILSKKFRGKKLFRVAPLHHHFEALGWPGYKVTMRFWIVSVVCALFGMIIALVGK